MEVLSKVKTASMDDKTVSMDDKTATMINKTTSMILVFQGGNMILYYGKLLRSVIPSTPVRAQSRGTDCGGTSVP